MNLVQLFGLSLLFCLAVLAALTLRFAVPQPPHPLLLLALAVLQTCSVIAKEALLRRRAARHAAPAPRRTLAHRGDQMGGRGVPRALRGVRRAARDPPR